MIMTVYSRYIDIYVRFRPQGITFRYLVGSQGGQGKKKTTYIQLPPGHLEAKESLLTQLQWLCSDNKNADFIYNFYARQNMNF